MSAPLVTAPFLASAAVLAAAGLAKLARPDDTARALVAAGLPGRRRLVRIGAAAELAVGVAAVAAPGPLTGGLVALSYTAFAVFVVTAVRRGWPLSSCGCFGRADARPSYLHAALDAAAAISAVGWAVLAPARPAAILSHQPWAGWPLVAVSAVIAGLAYAVWTNPVARVPR